MELICGFKSSRTTPTPSPQNHWFRPGGFETTNQAIRDNYLNGTDLWIQILPDGTNGFEVKVLVSSFEISASVDGAVEFNAELESTEGVSEVLSGGGIEG